MHGMNWSANVKIPFDGWFPIFVPAEYRSEIESFSKAALMDMVWDMAKQLTPPTDDGDEAPASDVIGTVRHTGEVVTINRKAASTDLK